MTISHSRYDAKFPTCLILQRQKKKKWKIEEESRNERKTVKEVCVLKLGLKCYDRSKATLRYMLRRSDRSG
jgi:hypothetical protein